MPPPAPLLADDPAEIGGHRLLGRLGAGGQGTVYLAEPVRGGPRVAVKRLSSQAMGDTDVRQRFVREAEAARQVASFCTAAVLAADFDADVPYIVSEYVEGRSLHQRIRDHGPMAGGDLSRLAVATATALVAIHEAGIVHRDFKPGNVLLGDGGARVIDFGIAQITEGTGTLTNSPVGTPSFMAPEQIERGEATPASDVFAWGAVLAFAATGASPFAGTTVPHVLHNVLNVEPDLSAFPDTLRPLVAAALSKDPAARPNTVDLLMTLLGRQGRSTDAAGIDQALRDAQTTLLDDGTGAVGAPTVAAPPPTPPVADPGPTVAAPPPRKPARVPRWLIGAGAVLLAAALVGAGVLLGDRWGQDTPVEGGQDPEPSGDDTVAEVALFSEEEAGTWEGVADSGNLYEVEIVAGERSADLQSPDAGSCSSEIRLLGGTEGGYRTNISFSDLEPNRCVDATEFWDISEEAELTFDGDAMTIDFFEVGEESEPRSTVAFSRAG